MENSTELLSVRELAVLLNVSEAMVRSMVFRRVIPFKKIGRLVRFKKSEIDSWVTERTVQEGGAWNN
jgi:excisionase family DNA binding protein